MKNRIFRGGSIMVFHVYYVTLLLVVYCQSSSHYCDAVSMSNGANEGTVSRQVLSDISSYSGNDSIPCAGCKKRTRRETDMEIDELERFRQFQIELNKMKLLAQLNLEQPPSVTAPFPDDLDLRLALMPEQPDVQADDPGQRLEPGDNMRISSIAIPGRDAESGPEAFEGSRTFHFHLKSELHKYTAKTTELWLHLSSVSGNLSSATLFVSQTQGKYARTDELPGVPGQIIAKSRLSVTAGWLRFDVSSATKRWLRHRYSSRSLTLTCLDCPQLPLSTDEPQVLLVMTTERRRHSRERREKRTTFNCLQSQMCCKETLRIDFKEIGWSDWIKIPQSYMANYCVGSCSEPHVSHYGRWLGLLQEQDPRRYAAIGPCCAAATMSPLTILYINNSDYITVTLPDMTVNTCQCR